MTLQQTLKKGQDIESADMSEDCQEAVKIGEIMAKQLAALGYHCDMDGCQSDGPILKSHGRV